MIAPMFRARPDPILSLFGRSHVVIGVIHCLALPGAPDYDGMPMSEIVSHAVAEGRRYIRGGVEGLIVENHGDIPFAKAEQLGPETAACMSVIATAVGAACSVTIGINTLANAAQVALAVAKASGARFIRVNQWANAYVANEGFVEGPAGIAARYRNSLRATDIRVFADVHVKHGAHAIVADRSIGELARDVEFFGADAAIATGQRTGDSASLDEVTSIAAGSSLPVIVGSGVTPDNVAQLFSVARGVIVASWLKRDGVWWNEVDPDRLETFMKAANQGRA